MVSLVPRVVGLWSVNGQVDNDVVLYHLDNRDNADEANGYVLAVINFGICLIA